MTLILENGSGVIGANSYVDTAFILAYLTSRGRETENLWSTTVQTIQENHAIRATDYVEQRFRQRFKGQKTYSDLQKARAVLTFTQQPANNETITIGSDTFTFVNTVTLSTHAAIGATLSVSIGNMITVINDISEEVSAENFFGQTLLAVAVSTGEDGNSLVSTTTVTNATWNFVTLNGGNDQGQGQPLSFPRRNLRDRDSILLLGIPINLKSAIAEYAVRSLGSTLLPDPTVDATGRLVTGTTEKVGPIEETITYEKGTGTANKLRTYPAADQLLKDFLNVSGGVFR